jgi:hypothetical protein
MIKLVNNQGQDNVRFCPGLLTVKRARGEVSFDSLNVKYASKLSCYASPEAYLAHLISKMTNTLFDFLSDKYASEEASLDKCEAYLALCESNDTLPRAHFYGAAKTEAPEVPVCFQLASSAQCHCTTFSILPA